MTDPSPELSAFERNLTAVIRLLAERDTVGDIAARCGHDLPPASWALLEHLHARGALRVSQIAACHGVQVSSITPRLKALESARLISRQHDATDGRVHVIEITPTGVQAVQRVHRVRAELLAGLIDTEGDDARLAAANTVLERLAHRLDHERHSDRAFQQPLPSHLHPAS